VSPAQSKRGGHSSTPVTPAGLRQRVASRPATRGCSAHEFCASGMEQKCLSRGAETRNNAKRNDILYIASKPRRALATPVLIYVWRGVLCRRLLEGSTQRREEEARFARARLIVRADAPVASAIAASVARRPCA
jgi:hypothetical protein